MNPASPLAATFVPLGFAERRKGQRRPDPRGLRYDTARVVGSAALVYGYDPRPQSFELLVVAADDGREYACCRLSPAHAISPLCQFLPRAAIARVA